MCVRVLCICSPPPPARRDCLYPNLRTVWTARIRLSRTIATVCSLAPGQLGLAESVSYGQCILCIWTVFTHILDSWDCLYPCPLMLGLSAPCTIHPLSAGMVLCTPVSNSWDCLYLAQYICFGHGLQRLSVYPSPQIVGTACIPHSTSFVRGQMCLLMPLSAKVETVWRQTVLSVPLFLTVGNIQYTVYTRGTHLCPRTDRPVCTPYAS
jgi:hypothetical protein